MSVYTVYVFPCLIHWWSLQYVSVCLSISSLLSVSPVCMLVTAAYPMTSQHTIIKFLSSVFTMKNPPDSEKFMVIVSSVASVLMTVTHQLFLSFSQTCRWDLEVIMRWVWPASVINDVHASNSPPVIWLFNDLFAV